MAHIDTEDIFGIPFVVEEAFSYYPYNAERLRAVKKSRRIAQAILGSGKQSLATVHCDRDYRHYPVHSARCSRECFLPEFIKMVLAEDIIPVAIVEPGRDPYIIDYNAILGISDSGNFLNPYLLQTDIYDKIVIGETPCTEGVDMQDSKEAMVAALHDCSLQTQVTMLNYLVDNLDDSDSFEIFRGLVLRSNREILLSLLDISRRQLGEEQKLTRLLQVSVNGVATQAVG